MESFDCGNLVRTTLCISFEQPRVPHSNNYPISLYTWQTIITEPLKASQQVDSYSQGCHI